LNVIGLPPGRSTLVARHKADQFAENGELKLELYAVHHALECGFDNVQVGEFDTEKRGIHEDNQDVDRE
jgi:hypothetical protein